MTRRLVVSLAVLGATALVPTAGAATACKNLLVDPAGDNSLPASATGASADLLSADLGSDRTALMATVRVTADNGEGARRLTDGGWQVAFSTARERFTVKAERTRTGDTFTLYRKTSGEDAPQDGGGASTSVVVPSATTGSIDELKGVVRMRVPLSAFAPFGGLGSSLTTVRAIAWSGGGAHPMGERGVAVYAGGDPGSTSSSYRVGARGCA